MSYCSTTVKYDHYKYKPNGFILYYSDFSLNLQVQDTTLGHILYTLVFTVIPSTHLGVLQQQPGLIITNILGWFCTKIA